MTIFLPKINAGDPIRASYLNQHAEEIAKARNRIEPGSVDTGFGTGLIEPELVRIAFAELDENIDANNKAKTGNWLGYNHSATPSADPWVDTEVNTTPVADPQTGVWLDGERRAMMFLPSAGRYIPLPGLLLHLGKLDNELTFEGTATCSIWRFNSTDFGDTGINVTVRDWLLGSGQTVASGRKVVVVQLPHARIWVVIAAEC